MAEDKANDIIKHPYYGPLIKSYIKGIFESQMLLDEDLEILLGIYNFQTFSEQAKYEPSYSLIACTASIFACYFLAKLYHSRLLMIPSVLITATAVSLEMNEVRNRRNHKNLLNNLLDIMRKLRRLNCNIVHYMETRVEIGRKCEKEVFKLFNKTTKEFLKIVAKREYSLFQYFMDTMYRIAVHSDDLTDDYDSMKSFNPLSILREAYFTNIEDCLDFVRKIQDIHIWLGSKLLCYIGILFFSSRLDEENLKRFLNVRCPHIISYLQQHHDFVKKQFISLRHSAKKFSDYKFETKVLNKRISTKLQMTLVSAVNNLSIISEKSQDILETIENDENNGLHVIDTALIDLKNHTYAAYESLDLLCKLYGILSHAKMSEKTLPVSTKTAETTKEKLQVFNYNDTAEPLEEQFELYITKDDVSDDASTAVYDDKGGEYLSLMLQELKQSLNKHQRFIEAKKRRGSEEDTTKSIVKSDESCIPQFDLDVISNEANQRKNALQINTKATQQCASQYTLDTQTTNIGPSSKVDQSEEKLDDMLPMAGPLPSDCAIFGLEEDEINFLTTSADGSIPKCNLAIRRDDTNEVKNNVSTPQRICKLEEKQLNAPTAPPLPTFNLQYLHEETNQGNMRSMLDNIKTLSAQRNVKEEVFGSSNSDSD